MLKQVVEVMLNCCFLNTPTREMFSPHEFAVVPSHVMWSAVASLPSLCFASVFWWHVQLEDLRIHLLDDAPKHQTFLEWFRTFTEHRVLNLFRVYEFITLISDFPKHRADGRSSFSKRTWRSKHKTETKLQRGRQIKKQTKPISSPVRICIFTRSRYQDFELKRETALWSGRCLCTRPTEVPRPQGG